MISSVARDLSFGNVLRHFGWVVLPPVIEFVLLRLFVHFVLSIRLGYAIGTDFDFIPQAALALLVLIYALARAQAPTRRWDRKVAIAHFSALGLFAIATTVGKSYVSYEHPVLLSAWFLFAFAILTSAVFLFIPSRFFFRNPNRYLILPAAFIATTNLITRTLFEPLWDPIARISSRLAFAVILLFVPHAHYAESHAQIQLARWDTFHHIASQNLEMVIGRGCSGLDGIFIFLFLFGVAYLLVPRRFSKSHWAALALCGCLFMFSVNAVRLVAFFLLSISFLEWKETMVWTAYAPAVLHTFAGWALDAAGLALFFSRVFPEYRPEFVSLRRWRQAWNH